MVDVFDIACLGIWGTIELIERRFQSTASITPAVVLHRY